MTEISALQPHRVNALQWVQPSACARKFELRSADTLVGRLEFRSALGSLAEATVAGKTWTLKRQGFFSPRATIRQAGSQDNLAVYTPHWTGSKGLLTFQDGNGVRLACTGFWGGEWAWLDAGGAVLVRFHNRGILHHGAGMDVEPGARSRPDLDILLIAGWYVLYLHQQDSAAAIGAA